MITIYHNPHCSKSREAFAMVEQFAAQRSLKLNVVDYLKNPRTRRSTPRWASRSWMMPRCWKR
jgi:arsenate reductase-like glutaredoxin family protein